LGLARLAARPRRWAFGGYYTGIEELTSRGEMHVRPRLYIGIAPLSREYANVCAVYEAPAGAQSPRVDPLRAIADAVSADPALRARFARARLVSAVTSLGPLAVDGRASGCPGLLLAGDAAGFVDPMTGDGLRFALRSAELTAAAALRELASGVPACADLHATRSREFSGKWRINRALRSIAGSAGALELCAAVARRWPGVIEYLIGVAGDVATASPRSQIPNPKSHVANRQSSIVNSSGPVLP
jgi:flavin-dependent dehydrogenase